MPAPLIATFAKESGKSEKEVERLYSEAKKQVEKEYDLTEKDGDRYYQLVVGILKRMLGLSKSDAVCGGCGSGVSLNDSFCSDCGSRFDEKVSIDTYRSEIRKVLESGGLSKSKIDIVLESKASDIMKYWKEGVTPKECLKKIFNVK